MQGQLSASSHGAPLKDKIKGKSVCLVLECREAQLDKQNKMERNRWISELVEQNSCVRELMNLAKVRQSRLADRDSHSLNPFTPYHAFTMHFDFSHSYLPQ
jgi:hypothetical protein